METVDAEVRARVRHVLDGATSIADFEAWFVQRTWNDRTRLVADVDHLLAEKHLLDHDGLLRELRLLAGPMASEPARPKRVGNERGPSVPR